MGPERAPAVKLAMFCRASPRLRGDGWQVRSGEDLLALAHDAPRRAGIFLAFQYPCDFPASPP